VRATTILAAVFGVAAGAVGALLLRPSPHGDVEPATEPAARQSPVEGGPSLAGASRPSTDQALESQLAAANARIAALTEEIQRARAPSTPAPASSTALAPGAQGSGPEHEPMTAAMRERALAMGVPEATLDAVWKVRWPYHGADAAARAKVLETLRPLGDDVARAVVALHATGGGHISLPRLVSDLKVPGGSALLISMIERQVPGAGALIVALPGYDSPEVRTYLVDRIARETDAATYWHLATALGALREPRGAEVMRVAQFTGPSFGSVLRAYILTSVGAMGGPRAVQLLEEYLRLPNADALGAALLGLEAIDPERARAQARSLKDSDRYAFLPPESLSVVIRLTR
jgi:hypothetical protein